MSTDVALANVGNEWTGAAVRSWHNECQGAIRSGSQALSSEDHQSLEGVKEMVFEVNSNKTLEQIDLALRDSALRHKFGILGVHDLKAKMKEKGVDFSKECFIYEVCNPLQAKKVLEANPQVSTALPCRISVFGEPGAYRLATLLPTELMQVFKTPGDMQQIAREVEEVIVQMMRDAS
jgi:uncharacterized protein (DUF302 family)